jgi:hypothetical protein
MQCDSCETEAPVPTLGFSTSSVNTLPDGWQRLTFESSRFSAKKFELCATCVEKVARALGISVAFADPGDRQPSFLEGRMQ